MALVRAFVAVTFSPDLVRRVEAMIAPLRAAGHGVSWTHAATYHLTLKFLGDVDDHRVEAIGNALAHAAAGVPAFDLALRGLGAFPTLARPRVIWAGARGPALSALAETVERALGPLGLPPEGRPFSAHVTLGRVREPGRDPGLAEAVSAAAGVEIGVTRVERIALMRSQLSPRGARHTQLAEAPLAPAP